MTQPDIPGERTAIEHRLGDLHASALANLTEATRDFAPGLGRIMQLDVDIRAWVSRLSSRPEAQLLQNARRELGFATYSSSSGLYLQAYGSVRIFLELSFAAVYFSVFELERRRWTEDRADFSWSRALDASDGVLSSAFVREFTPAAQAECQQFAIISAEKYRHCSQFIHGKVAATDRLPGTLSYSYDVLRDWIETAVGAAEAVLYLMYCRYQEALLPADDGILSATLEHSFSHLRSIRQALGLPVAEERDAH